MKVALILENGTRLTAQLSEFDAMWLLVEFIKRLRDANVPKKELDVDEAPAKAKPEKEPAHEHSRVQPETKLLAYKCGSCGKHKVIKVSRETDIGDVISCLCGYELQISDIKNASGDCPNCDTKFYNMKLLNGLTELQCRNCKSPIDLVETMSGTLTGKHNLKY